MDPKDKLWVATVVGDTVYSIETIKDFRTRRRAEIDKDPFREDPFDTSFVTVTGEEEFDAAKQVYLEIERRRKEGRPVGFWPQ